MPTRKIMLVDDIGEVRVLVSDKSGHKAMYYVHYELVIRS